MTRTTAHLHSGRRGATAAAAAAVALLASACAGAPPKRDLSWPDPPETPRIKLVRTIRSEADLRTSSWDRVRRALFDTDAHIVAYPTGVAVAPGDRYLYVAGPTRVVRIDLQEGSVKDAVSRPPRSPYGIAVDGEGRIYVGDHKGSEVWVYDPSGNPVAKLGMGIVDKPTGLAVDRRAQLLYVVSGSDRDATRHAIEVFSLKGDHLRTIGKRGGGPGEFNFPVNVAVGPDGRVHVTDMLNFRVQTFEREGQLYGMFGQVGVGGPGQFDKLKGIAVDSFGNIHVTDSHTGNVQVFNSRFQPLMAYGGTAIPLIVPTAIAIDSRNHIFIADYVTHAVHELELVNTTAEDSFPDEKKAPAAPAPASGGDKAATPSPAGDAKPATSSQPAGTR